ncbi:MAG: hypothetical protein PHI18_01420 [bacterium]|nr:hypothetical protein [bacterium]
MVSESQTDRSPLMVTRIAMLVAVGVAAGWLLSAIPNVELVTAVCFSAGFLLGVPAGLLTGALTEALFAGFHPMGSSLGPLLAAQVMGMAVVGLAGGMAAKIVRSRRAGFGYAIPVIGFGLLSTVIFDFLTNLAFPLMAGFSIAQTLVSLTIGLPFAAIHLAANAAVFIVIVRPLLPRLEKVLRVS